LIMDRYIPEKHKEPLRAIREHCTECVGGRDNPGYTKLIDECVVKGCALFEFRFSKNPHHTKTLSDEQRKAKADLITVTILDDKLSDNLS
jgi:hypothetical protein